MKVKGMFLFVSACKNWRQYGAKNESKNSKGICSSRYRDVQKVHLEGYNVSYTAYFQDNSWNLDITNSDEVELLHLTLQCSAVENAVYIGEVRCCKVEVPRPRHLLRKVLGDVLLHFVRCCRIVDVQNTENPALVFLDAVPAKQEHAYKCTDKCHHILRTPWRYACNDERFVARARGFVP